MRKKTTQIAKKAEKKKVKPKKIAAINPAILNGSIKKLFDTTKTIFDKSNFESFAELVYKINSSTQDVDDSALFVKDYLSLHDYARETIIKLLNEDGNSLKIKTIAKVIAKYGTIIDETTNIWEGNEDKQLYKDIFAEAFATDAKEEE